MRNKAIDAIKDMHKIFESLSNGPATHYIKQLQNYVDGLFSLAKFGMGELVRLSKTPEIEERSGWCGSQHFLKRGEEARVRGLDFIKKPNGEYEFIYDLVFDRESWINREGSVVLIEKDRRHTYRFFEREIERIGESS